MSQRKSKKKSHGPPFNSSVPINVKLGMHPKLVSKSSDAPAPGKYDPKPISKNCCHVLDWKKEEASREFSSTMGGRRFQEKYINQRELMRSGRGPGTHEIKQWPDIVLESNCGTKNRDNGFGVSSRFERNFMANKTPGPGYTGKNHNPYYYVEKNKFDKNKSSLPTFEFDGLAPRFEYKLRNWSIACNRYNPKDHKCLDKFLNKVTSRRGPYDLFTGPRNSTTLHSYQIQPKSNDTKNWPIEFPSDFEKSFGGCNRHRGVWTECPRFTKKPTVRSMLEDISLCYKDENSPGPGYYNVSSNPERSWTGTKKLSYPFNDSVKNSRPLRSFEISPGPTTYDLTNGVKKFVKGNGWTSIFKSKGQRSVMGAKIDQYNSF